MTSVLSHGIKNKNKNELLEVLREFFFNLEELKIINFINCDRPKTY